MVIAIFNIDWKAEYANNGLVNNPFKLTEFR